MRNEHKAQLRALRLQHEDEIKKLQEDLDLQKSKEEKQRALLQLQWKGMSDKTEEEQEVNSKKEYSIPSRRNPVVRRRGQRSLRRRA
uniref:synaptonemal complex protein 1-like n=1 Tax=Fragaria vesca subsp. vesca TaxID=101020 RepID=UPI0005CB75DE|nr:PREDICTED: synaptonemal complex protein 1-like [Fragaria vesca subsp. vesca]